jgi:hypothetical protein
VKKVAPNAMFSLRFHIFAPFVELINKGINSKAKDNLYDPIDVTFMTRSKTRRAFCAANEFFMIMLYAFIDVCLTPKFAVINLNCGTG